jgi:alcohol dehydrogenase class IV
VLEQYGSRVLLVTGGRSLAAGGFEDELRRYLGKAEVMVLRCQPGEPTVEGVQTLRESARGFRADVILAVGGGTVLDTAKALAGTLLREEPIIEFLEGIGTGLPIDRRTVPWIAMPTTAGTGSEATKNAVIKSASHGVKKSMRSVHLYADYAYVDPDLTSSLPQGLTGQTGLDALTQLVESYVTVKRNPLIRPLVRERVAPTVTALETLVESPDNHEARTQLAYGSMISGIALANAGLGGVHGFASGLGGSSELPHGLICAAFLAPVLRFNRKVIALDIADLMGGVSDAVEQLAGRVERLFEGFGLKAELRRHPFTPEQIPVIAERSAGSSMSGNPIEMTQEDKESLLRDVLLD